MKKTFLIIGAIIILIFPALVRADVDKAEFMDKLSKAQQAQNGKALSCNIDMSMSMMGIQMHMSGQMWVKNVRFGFTSFTMASDCSTSESKSPRPIGRS